MRICSTMIPVRVIEGIPQPEPRPVENLTPGVVKMFYEANPNTNAFTNAEQQKLADTYIFTAEEKAKLLSCDCNQVVTAPVSANGLTVTEQAVMDRLVNTGVSRNVYSKLDVDTLISAIPVFDELGGLVWKNNIQYAVGAVVIQSNVPYKCITAHVSTGWAADTANWEFIISDPGTF